MTGRAAVRRETLNGDIPGAGLRAIEIQHVEMVASVENAPRIEGMLRPTCRFTGGLTLRPAGLMTDR